MQTIELETRIAAPIERCFLLSLSIDLHKQSADSTSEQAIAGVTHGLIGLNETVTWRGRHFGFLLTHETRISAYRRPTYFQDIMVRGAFRSFEHDHFFEVSGDGTLMRDVLRFSAPLGVLGLLAERVALRNHMNSFLLERNAVIRTTAESEHEWKQFLT